MLDIIGQEMQVKTTTGCHVTHSTRAIVKENRKQQVLARMWRICALLVWM